MANTDGQRAVVNDPLAANPREQRPDRSLQLAGVRAPQIPSDSSLTTNDGLTQALGGIENLINQEFEKKKDGWITEGKVAYQSGVTEAQMLETGNAFTAQGYRTLQARDTVNQWFAEQTVAMDESGKLMDPKQYGAKLKEDRARILSTIQDEGARKVASAAFEDMSPRLAQQQAVANSIYNRGERVKSFSGMLYSTSTASATVSSKAEGQPLALSPVPVGAVLQPSGRDRDVGIRTMLGEAANQGTEGLAAVAHVLKNRTTDGRWPDSIAGVALQPKQFSAWNAGPGGNAIPYNNGPGSPMYERAAAIFDAVMSGKHVDPTNGATHYYSPAGMTKLVSDGDQKNLIPAWLDDEAARSGGKIKIGGHIFVGKAGAATVRPSQQVTATTLAAGTPGDLNAVPEQEGVGVTGVAQVAGANEIQQIIQGYKGLNDEDKAAGVADAMRRQLDAGNDTLFRDAGGVGVLHTLRAKPADIDEVLKAKKRFDEKQMTEFNVEREKYRNDIMTRAEHGESIDTILADIEKSHNKGLLNDAAARALATGAADKVRQQSAEKSKLGNPDMLSELAGLYQNIATGGDFKSLAEQGTAIARKYGATDKDVQQIVGKMFSDSQQYLNHMRGEAKTLAKNKAEQDAIKGEAARAISQGYGLGNVAGSVKVTNDAGQPSTVSAVDYGITQIKDKWAKEYSDAVNAGRMTVAQAKPELERKVVLELQNHGVVDKQMSAQFTGALSGNIIGKDGAIKPAAVKAYDSYLTLKSTPGINPGYLSKVIGDDQTRTLLETAFKLDSGDLSKEQSLLKAHELLNDPNRDPNDKIKKDAIWNVKFDRDLKQALLDRTDPGWLGKIFMTEDRSERERILTNNRTAENYVMQRAELYHMMNVNEDAEVSLEKALQDLQAHSTPVMGNLIITKPGKEIDKAMGVSGFGPDAAEDAISDYVRKNGVKLWGKSYSEREPSSIVGALSSANRVLSAGVQEDDGIEGYRGSRASAPPVHVTYNAELGVLTVDLYKDDQRKQTLGAPKHLNVKSIGDLYVKEQTTPTGWAKTWNSMFKGTAKAVKEIGSWAPATSAAAGLE